MQYDQFKKKLRLPEGTEVPTQLVYRELEAQAINRDHLDDDVAGINASLDLIRRTRGGPCSVTEAPTPTRSTTPNTATSAAATSTPSEAAPRSRPSSQPATTSTLAGG